jgi:hypothetical protein
MAAKPTRLTHKLVIQLHLVAESYTICSSHSTQPIQKLLDTTSYYYPPIYVYIFIEVFPPTFSGCYLSSAYLVVEIMTLINCLMRCAIDSSENFHHLSHGGRKVAGKGREAWREK